MKRLLLITALVVATSFYAQGQAKGVKTKGLEERLMQLQRAEEEAEDKKDLVALDRLLTDDFIFTSPSGAISDKRKLIDDVKHDEPGPEQTIDYNDIKTYDYGRTAVVNYLLIVKGRDKDGKDYTNRFRNTVIWVRQHGHWRMAAIHVSRIKP